MKIEPGRAIVFVIVFWMLGALIHNYLKYGVQRTSAVIQSVPTIQPPAASKAPPVVSISKIWPDGATPTKIVHIPDPQEPAQGLMDITLNPGDDLELDFDPLWIFNTTGPDSLAGTEIAIDDGSGFESLQEYVQNRDESGTNAWWMKSRIVRIRLQSGRPSTTYSVTVAKRTIEKPLPPVLPQTFDDLTITETGIHDLSTRKVVVDLMFRNTSSMNTIAVAMYADQPRGIQYNLKSSLICSDGTPYVVSISDIAGINALRTNLRQLISIEPGQELKASLEFEPRGIRSNHFTSFTLQAEIVVNSNYRDGEYDNYRETGRDVLPSDCKIVNAMFDIPISLR